MDSEDLQKLFDTGNFDMGPSKRKKYDDDDEDLDGKPKIKTERMDESAADRPCTSAQARADAAQAAAHSSDEEQEEDAADDDAVEVEPEIKMDEEFYKKYEFDTQRDENLPIFDSRDLIISAVADNPVVILEGETGCGKTTQVPQYILDDAYKRRQYCNIVCTQPRRIAAMSIAGRVAEERNWQVGNVVGFQVGLHQKSSEDTRLLYCTTGVLLKKLIKDKTLTHYTHIILDEVHERDIDMDFLLIVIRRFLQTNSRHVKVILMSATINSNDFSEYFTMKINKSIKKPAPIFKVDNRRLYEVREYFLDDLTRLKISDAIVTTNKPKVTNEMLIVAAKLIVIINNLEKQEKGPLKSVLVFLPGLYEIDEMFDRISQLVADVNFDVIRLHSLVAPDMQAKVFQKPGRGVQKIILATNIAESSITVPDVKYVIDFCLTKVQVTNTTTHFSSLQTQWASRANCRQRAGRAGRLMNGRVYRLVHKAAYLDLFDDFGMPEMLRCPLETAVLNAKLLDMGTPLRVISMAMSPPNLDDVRNTLLLLKEVGALYPTVNGTYSTEDGDLSFWGRIMAKLPLNVHLSRLVLLGYVFGCLKQAIIIAAGLTVRSIFTLSDSKELDMDAYIQKLVWADASGSDLVAIVNAYKAYSNIRMESKQTQYAWAKRNFINLQSMKEMELLVSDVLGRLRSEGIIDFKDKERIQFAEQDKSIVLKIVIAGAFYPNFFQIGRKNEDVAKERDVYHTMCQRNPCNTVYFTKYTPRSMGDLYAQRVKQLMTVGRITSKSMHVNFQPESEKVFVTFKTVESDEGNQYNFPVPGIVRPEVYKALRLRMLSTNFPLRVMEPTEAMKYVQINRIGQVSESVWKPIARGVTVSETSVVPSLFDRYLEGIITHVNHCGEFFFQPISERETMAEIVLGLSDPTIVNHCRFRDVLAISKGIVVSALFSGGFQRAEVLSSVIYRNQVPVFKVKFIDIGNIDFVAFDNIREIPEHSKYWRTLPPRVFQCRLSGIRPSVIKTPNGVWHPVANKCISKVSEMPKNYIEVYSVVHSLANILLYTDESTTLNRELLQSGLASEADEGYLSKFDHDLRLRAQNDMNILSPVVRTKRNIEYLQNFILQEDYNLKPPPEQKCPVTVNLQGPFSTLETKIYSMMSIGQWKSAAVERESVNSVLLQDDPRDFYDRMMVSMSITESAPGRDAIMARGTTLMPNIPGIAAIVMLIFAPAVQLKRNKNNSSYEAILAGLGFNPKSFIPYYGEHDVAINLDVNVDNEDIKLVNQIRYSIDSMFFTKTNYDEPNIKPAERARVAANIKDVLMQLLKRKRNLITSYPTTRYNLWEKLPAKFEVHDNVFKSRAIFPVHNVLPLGNVSREQRRILEHNSIELEKMVTGDASIPAIDCKLCNQKLENIVHLRIHLLSEAHRLRVEQLKTN